MSETTTAVAKKEPAAVEYVPYGAQDKIKMNVSIVQNLIAVKTKSGKTCSDKDALKFLAMCQAKRLNPFEGDAFLIGYDGREGPTFALITAHQTYLKRAELHPEFDGMKSGVIVREQDGMKDLEGDFFADGQEVVGGWATVFFKNRKQPMHKRLRLARFQKSFGIWQEDPAGMICKCFDEETEILTDRGFEKFATAEGHILQVTETGLVPTDAVPFSQGYNGEMIEWKSRNGNFCVTPNHDLPICIGGDQEKPIEANYLKSVVNGEHNMMPLSARFVRTDFPIEDRFIQLAAAYLADGSDNSASSGFSIAVSREKKVTLLRGLGLHRSEGEKKDAGRVAFAPNGREIITRKDKRAFYYSRTPEFDWLITRGKKVRIGNLLALSPRQAKLFVDTWIFCDGNNPKNIPVGRLYTSRTDHCGAFEIASNIAGYSVSPRSQRQSDIGRRNFCITASSYQEVNLVPAKIRVTSNLRQIWCVKVPTGKIIVRRHGFSCVSHNCAEADALRSAFPTMLGGLYMREEIDVVPQMAKPDFGPSKPLFENGKALPEPPAPESEAPQPDALQWEPVGDAPKKTPGNGFNAVKAVRGLCQQAKIKESVLLGFCFEIRIATANYQSLEELSLAQPDVLKMCSDQWNDIQTKIKESTGGAK